MIDTPVEQSPSSVIESIDTLFIRFLVGKKQIYKEASYNDGLATEPQNNKPTHKIDVPQDGWNRRILLDVEKQRVLREEADKRLSAKRNALLTRYFQQNLLRTIDLKLGNTESVIVQQLQLREGSVELLCKLLATLPSYSTLASLLEGDLDTRKRLIWLAGNDAFMASLGRTSRQVDNVHTALGVIGNDVLVHLVPAILFKHRINAYSLHNPLFAKKLWRYGMTLGQTCTALMVEQGYRRTHEGMLLSIMVNLGYIASYQQYLSSFDTVRNACLVQARENGEKQRHDFFYDIQTDSASLQALLVSQSNLQLSLTLSEKLFSGTFPHLVKALKEEVHKIDFQQRSQLGQLLFKALHFAKYEQLRAARLFQAQWLENYLHQSQIPMKTYNGLMQQELFRFKATW